MIPQDSVQAELTHLIKVSWILLVPAGLLLCGIFYKLFLLLNGLWSFFNLAQYELSPALKDIRLITENMESLSSKAVSSVESVEKGFSVTGSAFKTAGESVSGNAGKFLATLKRVFNR
ncbi:MAG: hypothetical protein AAGI66_09085 [Cyanobacteria bacterium P01_H01_bin.74]